MKVIILNASVKSARLDDATRSRIDLRLHNEVHAEQCAQVRTATKDALNEFGKERPEMGAVLNRAIKDGTFRSSIENGDNLDLNEPWNHGYEKSLKVSATAFGKAMMVDRKGFANNEDSERLRVREGVDVNVCLDLKPNVSKQGTAGIYANIVWVQYIGQSPAIPDDAHTPYRVDGAPELEDAVQEPVEGAPTLDGETEQQVANGKAADFTTEFEDGDIPF